MTDMESIRQLGLLLRQIFTSRFDSHLMVSHVYGHPERRLGKQDSWQHLKGTEAGIFLADRAAGPSSATVACKRPPVETTAKELLHTMRCLEHCVIVDSKGTPILEDPVDLIRHKQFIRYLAERDQCRPTLRWSNYIRDGPKHFFPSSKRFTIRARRTKIVFNWYLREEQLFKKEDNILCPLCKQDIRKDKEQHLYMHCTDIEIENIRLEAQDKLRVLAFNDSTAPAALLRVMTKLYSMITTSDEAHILWKGVIPISLWEELLTTLPNLESLDSATARLITLRIREMLLLLGQTVQSIRKAFWQGHTAITNPSIRVRTTVTPEQSRYLSLKNQTRLPTLWNGMTAEEQVDWELRRRLRKRNIQTPPTLSKRQTCIGDYVNMTLRSHMLQLIPSQVVIRKLFPIGT
jgi:hypothetical protein